MPVTHGVTGSSPVRTAKAFRLEGFCGGNVAKYGNVAKIEIQQRVPTSDDTGTLCLSHLINNFPSSLRNELVDASKQDKVQEHYHLHVHNHSCDIAIQSPHP